MDTKNLNLIKKQWIIDEPATEVVRKIYALCLAGHGPSQIARQLEEEQILVPSAYYESIGRPHAQKVPANPYNWDQKTVVGILENRQYTGCAVNFKTTTVSYKVHKTIYKPTEEHQIIPNMQEPIISEEQWLRVQELRQHRRRPTATGILSDERFSKMLQSYEKEQKALTQEVAESQQTLQEAKQKVTDLRLLLRTLREMTEINKLTSTLVNSLMERIEIHNNDKSSGHCYVKVDIYFTAIGMIDIPTEQEILAMMEEIRANPQDFRFVA